MGVVPGGHGVVAGRDTGRLRHLWRTPAGLVHVLVFCSFWALYVLAVLAALVLLASVLL